MMASKNYIIYKIVCDDLPDFIYVGSTSDFNYRKRKHRQNSKDENCKAYNYKLYTTINENGGWENWRMIQINQVQNVTKREAEAVEEEYRIELKANLNTNRAFLSPETKVEERKEINKKYRQSDNGKERQALSDKKYSLTDKGKARTALSNQKYRQSDKGKERTKERDQVRYVCNCGVELSFGSKTRHNKSQFHLNYIKEQN